MTPLIGLGDYAVQTKDIEIEQGPIRPPSEHASLLIRVNRNCPWNRCEFCGVYKGEKFSQRGLEEIKSDIDAYKQIISALELQDTFNSAFLQDGNALVTPTGVLVEVIYYLKEQIPSVKRVTTYSSSRIVNRKNQEDLNAIGQAGLSRIHIGLETGYGPLLEYMNKGATPEVHVEAGRKVKEAGISLSEYILFGLGGKKWTEEHATASAKVINQIDPDFIRSRRLRVESNTPLDEKVESGEFVELTNKEIVREQRMFIESLEGITSNYVSDHMNNPLMELEGKLPKDKQKLLDIANRFLGLR